MSDPASDPAALPKLASVFVLGLGGQWLAALLRVPSILLLLSLGFVFGPVQTALGYDPLIDPDGMLGNLLQPVVSLSVAVILFEGSLTLRFRELREIGRPLLNLLSIGVLITWVLASLAASYILNFDLANSLLLGALLTVTGPTVIGPMLLHVRPIGRSGPIARWEGIVVDPIGAVLAVLVFEASNALFDVAAHVGSESATAIVLLGLTKTVVVGVGLGALVAVFLGWLLRRHYIPDHLINAVSLMFVIGSFTVSNMLQHESGLVTVTVLGVLLANQKNVDVRSILEFKENLSVLLISSLFILLTARLNLEEVKQIWWQGPLFVGFLIVVVRPIAVLVSTWRTKTSLQERLFLAWLAPRGIVAAAVASVFALEGEFVSDSFVPATFMVIVGTVIVYGLTAAYVARWLGLAVPNPQGVLFASAHAGARAIASTLQELNIPVRLVDTNRYNIRTARLEGLKTSQLDILSENAAEQLDLGGVGRFIALTPNDEVNALATLSMSELFGRSQVYQLPPVASKDKDGPSSHLHGRYLFDRQANYWELDRRFAEGAVIKATKITAEFDWAALRAHYGPSVWLLFIVSEDGTLTINTTELNVSLKPGQTVITLADPADKVGPPVPEAVDNLDD